MSAGQQFEKKKLINLKFTTSLTFENERILWKVKLVKF